MKRFQDTDDPIRYAPHLMCNVACRVGALRKAVKDFPETFTPEVMRHLAPFLAPMPAEEALLSSNSERLIAAIIAFGKQQASRE